MFLLLLLIIPLIGISLISTISESNSALKVRTIKLIGLSSSIINLFVSMIIFILYNFSINQFQFVQECYNINKFDFYLGLDCISIYFVILTTIILLI